MGSYRLRSFFVLYPCIHSLSCDYTYASIVLYLPFWSKPPCPCLCIIITDKIHIWFLSYIAQRPEHPTLTSSVLMKFWTSMKSDAWKIPAFSSFHWSALLTASSTNLPLVPTIPTHTDEVLLHVLAISRSWIATEAFIVSWHDVLLKIDYYQL